MRDDDRIKNLVLSGHLILSLCRDGLGAINVVKNQLPDDAKIVHASVNDWGDVVLTIQSMSFPLCQSIHDIAMLESPTVTSISD